MVKGDETAWRDFEQRYFSRLLRYLLVLTGGRQEAAQEALQTALLRVVRYIKPFASEEVFWSWLTVVARSCVVDEQRKRTRYFHLLDRFFKRCVIEDHVSADRPAAGPQTDLMALLDQNLAALPGEDRRLLEQKYFARKSVKIIADETGTTEKAVESRLVRVRRKLHAAILAQIDHE